jgi:hypothetical protein
MTTAGHIAKAMRDIDDEVDRNDWVTAWRPYGGSSATWTAT